MAIKTVAECIATAKRFGINLRTMARDEQNKRDIARGVMPSPPSMSEIRGVPQQNRPLAYDRSHTTAPPPIDMNARIKERKK